MWQSAVWVLELIGDNCSGTRMDITALRLCRICSTAFNKGQRVIFTSFFFILNYCLLRVASTPTIRLARQKKRKIIKAEDIDVIFIPFCNCTNKQSVRYQYTCPKMVIMSWVHPNGAPKSGRCRGNQY